MLGGKLLLCFFFFDLSSRWAESLPGGCSWTQLADAFIFGEFFKGQAMQRGHKDAAEWTDQ